MESLEYIILATLIIGASYTSFRIGVRKGATDAVDMLEMLEIISFEGGTLHAGNNKSGVIDSVVDK